MTSGRSLAQVGERGVPTVAYHAGVALLYQGEYRDALEILRGEWRSAIKTPQSRWIDSICYHTMIGECLYQVGDLDQALEHYTAAVRLYLAFPDWMRRVQFPSGIQPSQMVRKTPWGMSGRPSRLGHYPTKMSIAQGRVDNNAAIKQGGIVQQAMLLPIEVTEIVECTVLAIRRRGELLGPVGRFDPLTGELIAVLQQRPGPANHWSQAWVDIQLAAALMTAGKDQEAVPLLLRSQVAGGEFDHPLTGTALLLLGRVALAAGNYADAGKAFMEASFAAYHYSNAGVLEEALCYGSLTHIVANSQGVYPPLMLAAQWAKVKDLRNLRVSTLLSAAEHMAIYQQTREATAALDEAAVTIGRRPIGVGRLGARLSFLRGLTLYQQGQLAPGDEAVGAAMAYMKRGSMWLFHIAQADGRLVSSQITPRVAMEVFKMVLRDPRPLDWTLDPMESLAVLTTPHPGPMERWFVVALGRNEHEAALEISDRVRRHRYFSSLVFGGRIQSLRWTLEAPDEALDPAALLHRQDLLAQHPAYDRLSKQARLVRAKIKAVPLVPVDQQAALEQGKLFAELATLSAGQETILREMAVRREPATLVFPPLKSAKEIQASLPKGTAVLAFFAAGNDMYAFLLTREKYGDWTVKGTPVVIRRLVSFLRDMGHFEQNHELSVKELAEETWRKNGQELLESILAGSNADFSRQFPELVIVPDGFLWYVPFEALQVKVDNRLRPLISQFRVRYAPTVSLTVADGRGANPMAETAVVLGRLYPGEAETVTQKAYEELSKAVPGTVPLSKQPLPAPTSLLKVRMGRLIVLDDLAAEAPSPYAWSPIQVDRGRTGNTLNDWLSLPWGGPQSVVLPGFHTVAENSLKRVNRAAPGSEVFLSVCGLLSTGSKTLLLSRWRTGGQSSVDLVREFAQELPHTTPSDAWQRAVLLLQSSRLNLEAEPRVKRSGDPESPKGEHPFFWAGYMLVDSGERVEPSELEVEAPGKGKDAPGKAKADKADEDEDDAPAKPKGLDMRKQPAARVIDEDEPAKPDER